MLGRESTSRMTGALPPISIKAWSRTESKVDWSERHETPAGSAVRGDPAGACDEEAPLPPRGKRVPAAEINLQEIHDTANVSVKAHF
ncbi:hypothetical protein [Heyndrickxia acidicola]|uniref:Uncharacterized protein n=1 Tax=Heyndrickxia acidicola TaxID=209389 RepID=A0ABU6MB40_9BACI|nr:hypothetical protein [Heyndrickxia acidicola]MED1201874.1 hypothetical protein [Heyndrickxia acidicola]